MYHIRQAKKRVGEKVYYNFQLRKTVYLPEFGATKSEYIASIGPTPEIGETALEELCTKHGLEIERIKAIKKLIVVLDSEYTPPQRGRKRKREVEGQLKN